MMISDPSRSKGEHAFIHEYTRNMLIEWASHQVRFGEMPETVTIYFEHAKAKGWISKDGTRVTSKGFASAAARCKA